MGEKGNVSGAALAGAAVTASSSLIERVTDTATETVVGVGQDFIETVKDKSIGAVADNTVAAARERMQRKDKDEPGSATPPASQPSAPDSDQV